MVPLIFFDDLTIFHEEWDSHIIALLLVFGIFRKNNLKGRPKKTEAGLTDVPLLGHHVGMGFLDQLKIMLENILTLLGQRTKNKQRVYLEVDAATKH